MSKFIICQILNACPTGHCVKVSIYMYMSKILEAMRGKGPVFTIAASKVRLLKSPDEFYQTLLNLTASSKRRIILSSLYFGNGTLEKKLVSTD